MKPLIVGSGVLRCVGSEKTARTISTSNREVDFFKGIRTESEADNTNFNVLNGERELNSRGREDSMAKDVA